MNLFYRSPARSAWLLPAPLAALAFMALIFSVVLPPAQANDHMFPAAAAAKPFVDFDQKGFLIHGKRTFIVSAGMEYARVPHALWRDRLLRLKRAGFNCVEVYTFWNWHEPQEGRFDFSGDHDLDAYLKLVHQMGMYAICRVGPYYCAEWDSGGYPLWLRFKPGLAVREHNPIFEAAVDKFFGRLLPIVTANQISHGGAVILVQLENEGASWGTDEANPYFTHLRTEALGLGLEVPYFFSGLHHGSDPAGNSGSLDDPDRPNPWISTEFWSVWYDHYGSSDADAVEYGRRTWKIIAHGGAGYNYYMAHGGTNFGYTNDNEDAASYDYGAAVGQTGDLRPIYFAFKRAAWFARSFADILENSTDAAPEATAGDKKAANPALQVSARTSPAGSILFLDNPTSMPQQTTVAGHGSLPVATLTLAPHEILPLVRDFPLLSGVTLQEAQTRILGIVPQGNTTTLVVYGPVGSSAALAFTAPQARVVSGAALFHTGPNGTLVCQTQFRAGAPEECAFLTGTQRVRILAVSDMLADHTWFVEAGTQQQIVCGPTYVSDMQAQGNHLRLIAEQPWSEQQDRQQDALLYAPTGPAQRLVGAAAPAHPRSPALDAWQFRDASAAAAPEFDDHAWLAGDLPPQMGADGDLSADAWYRARITVPSAGDYVLSATGGDRVTAFVDGLPVGKGDIHSGVFLSLPKGRHTFALFTAHDGRDKLYAYTGSLLMKDPKGLTGAVSIEIGSRSLLTQWRTLAAASQSAATATIPGPQTAGWKDYTIGTDAFNTQPGFAWFQSAVPATVGASHVSLHFENVDDNVVVFLNGAKIGAHQGWNTAFDLPIPPGPPAVLTLLVENTAGPGGINSPARLEVRRGEPAETTGWKLHGGPGDPEQKDGWRALQPPLLTQTGASGTSGNESSVSGPMFFRTAFTAAPPPALGPHPIWRVLTTGLGHGSLWVNGHNLGRYPEKVPVQGLYIPECWLSPAKNTLVIYDEDGKRPDSVTVTAEAAASRDTVLLTPAP